MLIWPRIILLVLPNVASLDTFSASLKAPTTKWGQIHGVRSRRSFRSAEGTLSLWSLGRLKASDQADRAISWIKFRICTCIYIYVYIYMYLCVCTWSYLIMFICYYIYVCVYYQYLTHLVLYIYIHILYIYITYTNNTWLRIIPIALCSHTLEVCTSR